MGKTKEEANCTAEACTINETEFTLVKQVHTADSQHCPGQDPLHLLHPFSAQAPRNQPHLRVHEAPELVPAQRLLQDALGGEVKGCVGATGGVHPVHGALAVRVLRQHMKEHVQDKVPRMSAMLLPSVHTLLPISWGDY